MRPIHVAIVASVLALAGCGVMPVPTGSGTPTTSPSPSASVATPSASPTATSAASDVLFTISATLTSPVGAIAHIEQVVHAPTSELSDVASVTAQLDEECDGWRARFGQPDYVVSIITTTDLSTGGKKWSPAGQVVVSMAGTAVYQGDFTPFQSYCTSVQALIPATIRGVTPVPAGGSPDSAEGWGTITYGFGIATEPGTDATDPQYTQLSDCAITVTALGKQLSAIAAKWTSSNISHPGSCEVNHPGV
ncbi:MAG: hypothetical protein KF761_11820 [Salinibacterium sp.]|nr:hypothetical protein [Salinibacterium sp.]